MLQSPGGLQDVPPAWRQVLLRDYNAADGVTAQDILAPRDAPPTIGDQFASTVAFQGSTAQKAVERCCKRLKESGREAEVAQLLSYHKVTFEELETCFELSELPGRDRVHTGGSPHDLTLQSKAVSNYCRHEHWRSDEYLAFEADRQSRGLPSADMILESDNHGWVPKGLLLKALAETWPSNRPAIEHDSFDCVLYHLARTSDKMRFALLAREGQIIAVRCHQGHTSFGRINHAANMTPLMPAREDGSVDAGYAVLPPIVYHCTAWKRCRMILQGNLDSTYKVRKNGRDQNCYSPLKPNDAR